MCALKSECSQKSLADKAYLCFTRRRPKQCLQKKKNCSDARRQRPLHAVSRLGSGKTPVYDARLPPPLGIDLVFWKRASVFLAWLYFQQIPTPNTFRTALVHFSLKGRKKKRKRKSHEEHMCIKIVYFTQWCLTNGGKLLIANLPRSLSFLRKSFALRSEVVSRKLLHVSV